MHYYNMMWHFEEGYYQILLKVGISRKNLFVYLWQVGSWQARLITWIIEFPTRKWRALCRKRCRLFSSTTIHRELKYVIKEGTYIIGEEVEVETFEKSKHKQKKNKLWRACGKLVSCTLLLLMLLLLLLLPSISAWRRSIYLYLHCVCTMYVLDNYYYYYWGSIPVTAISNTQ